MHHDIAHLKSEQRKKHGKMTKITIKKYWVVHRNGLWKSLCDWVASSYTVTPFLQQIAKVLVTAQVRVARFLLFLLIFVGGGECWGADHSYITCITKKNGDVDSFSHGTTKKELTASIESTPRVYTPNHSPIQWCWLKISFYNIWQATRLRVLPQSWKSKMSPSDRIVTFQISRHFPLNHDHGRKFKTGIFPK